MKRWIAKPGRSQYRHRFGGDSWHAIDPDAIAGGPTLLLSLDSRDPRLESLANRGLDSIPLCSYVNCDVWINPQVFKINTETRSIQLARKENFYTTILPQELAFDNPLPEKSIELFESSGFNNFDSLADGFLGGEAFIQVLGTPPWLQGPEPLTCMCGRDPDFVAAIGNDYGHPTNLIDQRAFFIGETALYFFVCFGCFHLTVLSQPT